MKMIAECPRCKYTIFTITENYVQCSTCGKVTFFEFMDDNKVLCTTMANDIVKLVNEGD